MKYGKIKKSEIVNITYPLSSEFNVTFNTNYFFHPRNGVLIINGNGAIVNLKNHNDRGTKHFLICEKNVKVIINNLTISGFNTAIYNYGNMILKDVTFKNNRMNYFHDINRGGAIINNSVLTCINCSFINNAARYCSAIFSNGSSSKLNLTNCFFENNTAYSDNGTTTFWRVMHKIDKYTGSKEFTIFEKGGHDVLLGGGGIVFSYHLDNSSTPNSDIRFGWDDNEYNTIVLRDSFNLVVKEYVINDSVSFEKTTSAIWNEKTNADVFIVNMTGEFNIKPWSNKLFYPKYGNLIINDNGGTVKLISQGNKKDYYFAFINPFSSLKINNLTISEFNCSIINYGVLDLSNVNFFNNKIYHYLEDDDAGAIYNLGFLNCYNCSFVNNSGEWAGAVYSAHGAKEYFVACNFINNTHYNKKGADVYNFNHGDIFIINDDDYNQTFTINYGYLPSKTMQEVRKVATYAISLAIGAGLGFICPVTGVLVGTVVGTGLDVINDMYYAKANHQFSYSIFNNISMSLFSHFMISMIGASSVTKDDMTKFLENEDDINEFLKNEHDITDFLENEDDINEFLKNEHDITDFLKK